MTKLAKKFHEELDNLVPDGTEWVMVEQGKKKRRWNPGAWRYVTSGETLVDSARLLVNGNGSAVTINAPSTIREGMEFEVANIDRNATPALVTFGENGKTLRYAGQDVADDVTIETGERIHVICQDGTNMEIV
jgi:hypothetical protein